MIKKVISIIDNECLTLCRRSQPSIFRKSKPSEFLDFKWSKYIEDMESKSPVLLQLCNVIVTHGDSRKDKPQGNIHLPGVCMAVSVLLKERNREIIGLQTYVSMLLYTSRVQKQVNLYIRISFTSLSNNYV